MRAACRAVCLAAALLLVACPIAEAGANAAAASPAPAVSPYADTIGLINAGRFEEARALAVATAKTERARRLNLMFVDALILKYQGRYAEAAALLVEYHADVTGSGAPLLLGETTGGEPDNFPIALVARLAAEIPQGAEKPRPLYLRAPDAKPQTGFALSRV
mgnify:CR=1 FL=1